ncbi:MAG: hypothetical protein ACOYT4_04525 [Nanoarchaeota archaeon]
MEILKSKAVKALSLFSLITLLIMLFSNAVFYETTKKGQPQYRLSLDQINQLIPGSILNDIIIDALIFPGYKFATYNLPQMPEEKFNYKLNSEIQFGNSNCLTDLILEHSKII